MSLSKEYFDFSKKSKLSLEIVIFAEFVHWILLSA